MSTFHDKLNHSFIQIYMLFFTNVIKRTCLIRVGTLLSDQIPWVFYEISRSFSNFSLSNSGENNSLEYIFFADSATYSTFSLSFPGFFYKNSNFPEFSLSFWQFFKLPEFSRFSMISRFVTTLLTIMLFPAMSNLHWMHFKD